MQSVLTVLDLGCEIVGSSCKIGVTNLSATLREHTAFNTPKPTDLRILKRRLFDKFDSLSSCYRIRGLGLLLPGYLGANRTVPDILVNLPMLEAVPLANWLSRRYIVPVAIDIDRNGPALAECIFGRGFSRSLYVTIGTGLGVGFVTGGAICRVCRDYLRKLGHMTLHPGGIVCAYRNLGCAETLFSIDGIRSVPRKIGLGAFLLGRSAVGFPKALYLDAVCGSSESRQIFEKFRRYLGVALVAWANAYSPDDIVIGGGLSAAADYFLPSAERSFREHWIEHTTRTIMLRRTCFGEHAGVIGAVSSAFQEPK